MQQAWFWIISLMLTLYAIMDGFDFGVGVLHPFVAKTDSERREVLGAIGPFWDGNEVWLLASGGALLVAFPRVMTAAFSGFYLALFVLIWTLILRAISIEFRNHLRDSLWRAFWDALLALSSTLIPILLGAALGNVLRGVPVDATGNFNITWFTHFGTRNPVGILDWYTVLVGGFVLLTVVGHGATFLAWKATAAVEARARRLAFPLWIAIAVLGAITTYATAQVNPQLYKNLGQAPMGLVGVTLFAGSLIPIFAGLRSQRRLTAFLGSCGFIMGLLVATAGCLFPVMLRSSIDAAFDLTAVNSASSAMSLSSALGWWAIGFPLAVGYAALLFYLHRRTPAESASR